MTIRARPLHVSLPASAPRHWYGGQAFETHFFNALSSLLPEGERFIMQATRHFADRLVHRNQQDELAGFIAQEGNHSKNHELHIQQLLAQGYSGLTPMNRFFRSIMRTYLRYTPRYSLAVAAAVEHITTTLAHTLTSAPDRWLAPMSDEMRTFWHWHAIEELEHKAVTYDLYTAIQGDYPLRMLASLQVLIGFSADVFVRHCYLLAKDDALFDLGEWRRGTSFLLGREGLLRNMLSELRRYLRRDFHPDQIDDQALIDQFDRTHAL